MQCEDFILPNSTAFVWKLSHCKNGDIYLAAPESEERKCSKC